jgi:hypothetical protein
MKSTLQKMGIRFSGLISEVTGRAYVPSENLDGAVNVAKRLSAKKNTLHNWLLQ